jgi:hypothetical protein
MRQVTGHLTGTSGTEEGKNEPKILNPKPE